MANVAEAETTPIFCREYPLLYRGSSSYETQRRLILEEPCSCVSHQARARIAPMLK